MNWESKFSSIVQETEANLAKVKEKLRGKKNCSPSTVSFDLDYRHGYSSLSPRLSSSVYHYPLSSTPKSCLTDRYSVNTVNYHTQPGISRSPPTNDSHLQDKINHQTKTIEELTRQVRNLEKERGQYQDQIRQLRSEVSQLSSQVLNHSSNPHLEWQMDQMKRNLMRELQEVRDQLKLFRSRVDRHSSSDHSSSLSMTRDIDEVRHDIQEELQYVKNDLDVLRKRLGSVELGVMASHYDKRDLERTTDRMSKSLREITNGRTRDLVDVLRTCPEADRSLNHLQVDQLRCTVQSLKDKLDSVETRLHSTLSPWKPDTSGLKSKTRKPPVRSYDVDVDIDSDFDDEDLDTDDLSVDLEDSDIEPSSSLRKIKSTKKVRISSISSEPDLSDGEESIDGASFHTASVEDDDLDIDDLDIDDDDDVDV